MRAFHFINDKIIQMHKFHESCASVELIDLFIKHFIIHCPNRLQELFNVCEEELCCIEELSVSDDQIGRYSLNFKILLTIIKRLYEAQTPQLNRLSKHFFSSDFVSPPSLPL